MKTLVTFLETQYTGIFQEAYWDFNVTIPKYKMADPKWRNKNQKVSKIIQFV